MTNDHEGTGAPEAPVLEARETLLEAFEAVGAGDVGVIYVTVPITSGRREFALLHELSCTREDLRTRFRDRWLREVVQANEEEARVYAQQSRKTFAGQLVVDPSRIHARQWTQDDFDKLWSALIEKYARRVVITPGWAFSRGARHEVGLALSIGLPISDPWGVPLTPALLLDMLREAEAELERDGWTREVLREYLPPVPILDSKGELPWQPSGQLPDAAAAVVFAWLVAERSYQLQKFGVDLDDRHTQEGLSTDGWWWQQLTNYFHRAHVLGLNTPIGRQALAKFTATACGLLESAVRVFGPLPPASVPSGELGHCGPRRDSG